MPPPRRAGPRPRPRTEGSRSPGRTCGAGVRAAHRTSPPRRCGPVLPLAPRRRCSPARRPGPRRWRRSPTPRYGHAPRRTTARWPRSRFPGRAHGSVVRDRRGRRAHRGRPRPPTRSRACGISTRRSTIRSSRRNPQEPSTYCSGSPAARRVTMSSKRATPRSVASSPSAPDRPDGGISRHSATIQRASTSADVRSGRRQPLDGLGQQLPPGDRAVRSPGLTVRALTGSPPLRRPR